MSDQHTGETKNGTPFPKTTSASPVHHQENANALDAATPTASEDSNIRSSSHTNVPRAVENIVKRALDAEREPKQVHHSAWHKKKEILFERAIDGASESTGELAKKFSEHALEPCFAGGAVALAAAGPVAITLAICGVLKVVGGCVVDHFGAKFRGSHNKWWSSFGDTLLGDKRVTKIMVQAMQAEPCSSMLTELKYAMCSMETNVDAQTLAQQGILSGKYQAYKHLWEARKKAISFLHNSENGEPMSYVMAARVIMVFDCLCDRRALHSKALVTMEKLMTKDRVQDLMKQASNSRTKDYMSPLGELISFVQMTNEFIGMHNVDVGIPDYDAYVICL